MVFIAQYIEIVIDNGNMRNFLSSYHAGLTTTVGNHIEAFDVPTWETLQLESNMNDSVPY